MSNNKDFKVKNGIQPTSYFEGVGTVVSAAEGFSIPSSSYDSKSFSIGSQEIYPNGLAFKSDGTKMYVSGPQGNDINEYALSTAWDVSTASYTTVFSFSGQTGSPQDVFFKPDGTKLYVVCADTDRVFQYSLSTAWDISTASYDSVSFNVAPQDGSHTGLYFKPDGTKMYTVGYVNDRVYEYNLSTAWDISTASFSQHYSISAQEGIALGLDFSYDGTKFFVVGNNNDTVYQYNLSTPWDVSTASYSNQSFSVASQDTQAYSIRFKPDGTKMYIGGADNTTVYQYSTVLNTASLDLSTGSVFDYTPTSDVQVTLSNPAASGTSSGATLLLTGTETTGIASTFSTTLYTGDGSGTQTITNNIDLANDGGLVWIKDRVDGNSFHALYDTERGTGNRLVTNNGNAQTFVPGVTSFNTDGFQLGTTYDELGNNFVSWTFKKAAGFFDIVTYTGDGTNGREIAHSLGADVGFITIKRLDAVDAWNSLHRNSHLILLNSTDADYSSFGDAFTAGWFGNSSTLIRPTSTVFTVGASANANGATYVAYLWAHDVAADGLIQCGSYVGNGSTNGPEINLGWEPQWLLVKKSSAPADWFLWDTGRGLSTSATDPYLKPNTSAAENDGASSVDWFNILPTGFKPVIVNGNVNGNGDTYIYIAIRAPYTPTVTYDPNLQWSAGTAPTAPALGETDVITFNTTDGGTTYTAVQAIDGAA